MFVNILCILYVQQNPDWDFKSNIKSATTLSLNLKSSFSSLTLGRKPVAGVLYSVACTEWIGYKGYRTKQTEEYDTRRLYFRRGHQAKPKSEMSVPSSVIIFFITLKCYIFECPLLCRCKTELDFFNFGTKNKHDGGAWWCFAPESQVVFLGHCWEFSSVWIAVAHWLNCLEMGPLKPVRGGI